MLAYRLSQRVKGIAYSVSALIGVAIVILATFVSPGFTVHPAYDNTIVFALIIALFPPSILDLMDRRWRTAVDGKIPNFLRDIAESQKTGMPFMRAIEHSARLNYGLLTGELRRTASLLSWGIPYTEALHLFAERIATPLAYRTVTLLTRVGESGGNLFEILETVYTHVRDVQDLERDRRRQMVPYVSIIYASFGVYLFVVLILFTTFFNQVRELVKSGAPFGEGINPDIFYVWFFHMSTIEALVGGFMAGKMGEGAMAAGFKHVLILNIISVVIFVFVIKS